MMKKIFIPLTMLACIALAPVAHAAGVVEKFQKTCAACHVSGAMGAPKKGDKAAWAPRLKQGMPALVAHAKNGFKTMPPKGLCMDCSDADFAALIKYMAN